MVAAWDTINVHSLLNQVQLQEEFKNKTYIIGKNTGTRGKLLPFWDTFLALGLLKQNFQMKSNKLVAGAYFVVFRPELSILECCCLSLYINVLRWRKRVMTQFWSLGSREVTLLISKREREKERERKREKEKERERGIWSILTRSACTKYYQ